MQVYYELEIPLDLPEVQTHFDVVELLKIEHREFAVDIFDVMLSLFCYMINLF